MSAAHRWHRDQRRATYPAGRFARSVREGAQLALPHGTTVGACRFHACPRARAHRAGAFGRRRCGTSSVDRGQRFGCVRDGHVAWARTLADAATHRMTAPNWVGLSLSGCSAVSCPQRAHHPFGHVLHRILSHAPREVTFGQSTAQGSMQRPSRQDRRQPRDVASPGGWPTGSGATRRMVTARVSRATASGVGRDAPV